uniref:60S ribosomal protein L28 n=1 Tax=Gorilla gorilla gorilla TaxID=9595 RepID=A0A2I2ZNW7_GORGO
MSAHLQSVVVQNCSGFLIKRNKQTYSTEPNNLKTVGVEPAAHGKGVLVVMNGRLPPCGPSSTRTLEPNSAASDT